MTSRSELPGPPTNAKFLPGRNVFAYVEPFSGRWDRGVVTDVDMTADREYTVHINHDGTTCRLPESCIQAVNPDRPTLAHDDLYAVALGEILAERAGPAALAEFRDGYNNGRVAFKEAARDVLARLDAKAREAARRRCRYTYVAAPDGTLRSGRGDFEDGDRLVACLWFPDGPGTVWCAPHKAMTDAGQGSSIYQPTADEPVLARDVRRIDAIYLPPTVAPTPAVTS